MTITELNRELQEAANEDRNIYLLLWLVENLEQIQNTLQITERMIDYCKRNPNNLQHEKLMDFVRKIEAAGTEVAG